MPDFIDGSENVSVHGIFNWILLLAIFSIITVIGNYIGYKHPITDSLVGMAILSLITLAGVWMERYLPFNISSIIYISVMGIVLAFPGMPTSEFCFIMSLKWNFYLSLQYFWLMWVLEWVKAGMSSRLLVGEQ